LSKKHQDQNQALGRKRPDVLAMAKRTSRKSKQRQDRGADSDSGHGGSETSGDEADEMDVDQPGSEGEGEVLMDDDPTAVPRGVNGVIKGARGRDERIMMAEEVREHLRKVFQNQPVVCSLLYGRHGPNVWQERTHAGSAFNAPKASADIFFMDVVPVPPTRFRPASKMGDSLFENPQNSLLSKILTTAQLLVSTQQRLAELQIAAAEAEEALEKTALEAAARAWTQLLEGIFQMQHDVNSFLDSSKNPTIMKGGMLPPAGVKQILEKKEGLFRKHMMVSCPPSLCQRIMLRTFQCRVNVLISLPDPSFRPISTLRRTKSVFLPFSLEN
jgi:DNA-directed RNA polymerase I subunit RPA1